MINGIKPIISNTTKTEKTMTKNGLSFDDAVDTLLVKIQEIINLIMTLKKFFVMMLSPIKVMKLYLENLNIIDMK